MGFPSKPTSSGFWGATLTYQVPVGRESELFFAPEALETFGRGEERGDTAEDGLDRSGECNVTPLLNRLGSSLTVIGHQILIDYLLCIG